MKLNPKETHIDNIGFKNSIKKALKKAGLKTAWDVAEYHNKHNITSISGIGDRHLMHIAKTLHQDTGMEMPDVDKLNGDWEWANVPRIIKIFISQPMSGRTDEEVLNERQEAIKHIYDCFKKKKNTILVFLDQYFVDDAPADANAMWYLGHSISMMSKADYIYFTGVWTEARGCLIEAEIAKMYKMKILNEIIV